MKKAIAKIIMIILLSIFAINNLKYIIEVGGDIRCFGMSMFLGQVLNKQQAIINVIGFIAFMLSLTIAYLLIVTDKEEKAKNDIKNTFIFIAIITVITGFILPNCSTDVYYYSAVGRLDSQYNVDLYEENFNEASQAHMDDNIIKASPQVKHKFIYGPVWAFICKVIGLIKTDRVAIPIFMFKLLNIIVHMLNCYIIYKISKNKKLVLLYGLNPLVLFDGIINAHNDIFLVLSILLGIYFKKQNKIGLAVFSIAVRSINKICTCYSTTIYLL